MHCLIIKKRKIWYIFTGLLVEAMDQIRLAGVLEISIAAEND